MQRIIRLPQCLHSFAWPIMASLPPKCPHDQTHRRTQNTQNHKPHRNHGLPSKCPSNRDRGTKDTHDYKPHTKCHGILTMLSVTVSVTGLGPSWISLTYSLNTVGTYSYSP